MYHTISSIDKTINLQQYIDNRDGNKRVGLKSFTYALGWYNVVNDYIQKTGERPHRIQDGFYSFQQISDVFDSLNITLSVNETNGIASLITDNELKISEDLKLMLGFGYKRKFEAKTTHIGEKNVDFATIKSVYVHLEQLNTSHNYFNGSPSTILAVVPIENKEYGDVVSERFEHPEFKYLSNGAITDLEISVRDENGWKIDNHGLPISAVLYII
jgi:hypothetical protein